MVFNVSFFGGRNRVKSVLRHGIRLNFSSDNRAFSPRLNDLRNGYINDCKQDFRFELAFLGLKFLKFLNNIGFIGPLCTTDVKKTNPTTVFGLGYVFKKILGHSSKCLVFLTDTILRHRKMKSGKLDHIDRL